MLFNSNSTERYKKKHFRHETELKGIKALQTPFPLGFNDNIYHEGHILGLQLALMRTKKGFPSFIGYPNFINDITKLVSSQTLSIKRKVSYTLLVMIRKRFSLLQTIIEDITFGLVRMYVTHYRFSWTIFIFGLALSYTDKLLVFRWVQIVLLL